MEKRMMKRSAGCIAALLLCLVCSSYGQAYKVGVGVRGGVRASGVDVKYNFSPSSAVEGLVSFQNGINFFGLYERSIPVIDEGFSFYYGGGANIGSWRKHHQDKFTVGIDGIIGLEYKIKGVPLALAVDYKPIINFVGQTSPIFLADDFGFSVKVVF